eukprot:1066671-Pelagomonas_calceolata.AAC.1
MINAIHVVTERTPFRGGRFVESAGMLLSRPEGVADFLVSKLTAWVVSFYISSGDWGIGLYGM